MTVESSAKRKKRTTIALIVLIVVLLGGVATAIDLTYIHFKVSSGGSDYRSFCNINETINCDVVSVSPWATLLGVPISLLGTLTYLFCFVLSAVALSSWRRKLPNAMLYLFYISLFSIGYSVFLAWICYAEIGSWCLMCMLLYLINLLFFIFATIGLDVPISRHFKRFADDFRWLFGRWTRILAGLVVLAGVIGLFGWGHFHEQSILEQKLAQILKDFEPVKGPVSGKGNVLGNPEGEVEFILYSDYQCPFCRQMELVLEELTEKYPQIKIIRKELPLDQACNPMIDRPFHPYACMASIYAKCAGHQDRFASYHHYLLQNQKKISPTFLQQSVKALRLDAQKMDACLTGPDVRTELRADITEAMGLKIPGTPALVVDRSHLVVGAISKDVVEKIIQFKLNEK